MKPTYDDFSAKQNKGFIDVPPVGSYEAQILNVRYVSADDSENFMKRDYIELFIDITEGEYKGRFMELWQNHKEKWGDGATYKGIYRLVPPTKDDEPWRKAAFEGALWCIEQSNDGYHWDWEEKKLAKKKIGITLRKRLYTNNGKNKETTEIGRLETIQDVKDGKCRPMNPRDNRTRKDDSDSIDGTQFTEVSQTVDVPW